MRGENLEANEYQKLAARTLDERPDLHLSDEQITLVWTALGLTGEAGEVAEHIKKGVFHQHGIDKTALKKELGDVLWYLSALCTALNLDLSEIMDANLEKLRKRYPNGFTAEDSKKRSDVT